MVGSPQDLKTHLHRTGVRTASSRNTGNGTSPSEHPPGLKGRPRRGAYADTVATLGKSRIHHGPHNDRIFLAHLDLDDLPEITDWLEELAEDRGYSRIFARVPAQARDHFVSCGYTPAAYLPRLFRGEIDGYYMANYLDAPRVDQERIDDVLAVARAKAEASAREGAADPMLEPGFTCVPATPADAPAIAAIYREIFETYPVPIHDPAYLARKMQETLRCFCIRTSDSDRIVAVASAETNLDEQFAEMTGFATLPEYQGHGFASYLLREVERDIHSLGIKTAFAIARGSSYPANITFARAGYKYAGTLAASVNICGSLETMNVWYRPLGDGGAPSGPDRRQGRFLK